MSKSTAELTEFELATFWMCAWTNYIMRCWNRMNDEKFRARYTKRMRAANERWERSIGVDPDTN